MKLDLLLLASLAWSMVASAAAADGGAGFSRVALLLPACEQPSVAVSELRAALSLDLRDEGLLLAPAGELSSASDVVVSIEAACAAGSELTLVADFAGQRRSRRLSLGEVRGSEHVRVLSLAIAELLSRFSPTAMPESGAEAPQSESPDSPLAGVEPPPGTLAAASNQQVSSSAARPTAMQPDQEVVARPRERPFQLALSPELRWFPSTLLWGGRAFVRYARWTAGVDGLTSGADAAAGSVRVVTVHASFACAFSVWGREEAALLEVGPRVGLGRTFMTARASELGRAASAEDVYVDGAAGVRYSRLFLDTLRLGLFAELGYARGPVGYVDDAVIARTSGPFVSLLADIAWQP